MPSLGALASPLLLEFRKAWSHKIRAIYQQTFAAKCPKTLYLLQSLHFLPKILDLPAPWQSLDAQHVADRCGVSLEVFLTLHSPLVPLLMQSQSFAALCTKVSHFRLEKKQDCCATLRQLTTWNVSGWRTVHWTNPKARHILRYARKGIVCLQETRWANSTANHFLQTYPGFAVAHSPAVETERGGLSEGVAIIIPCSFRLLEQREAVPGRAIAARLQTRTDQFWVMSVYCHPNTGRVDCETIAQWLHNHCTGEHPCFLAGDVNQSDSHFPEVWQRVLDNAQGDDIIGNHPAFWGPNGTSSLDRVVLPTDYINRGLIQHQVRYDQHFQTSGHACITIKLNHRPPVASSTDLRIHMTIPASVLQPGKDLHDSRQVWPSLQSLIRRFKKVVTDH